MKREIDKVKLQFLQKEMRYFEEQGILQPEQIQMMLSSYTIKRRFNFIRTLLVIGAILVGLGVLSFIAGNWNGCLVQPSL